MGTQFIFFIPQINNLQSPTIEAFQRPCCYNRDYRVSKNRNTNNIEIKTLDGCKLGISRYRFEYNAEGGRGIGCRFGQAPIRFKLDTNTVHIPPLTHATAKIDGWAPYPPFVKIVVAPEILEGNICEESGKVKLRFKARLWLSIGTSYRAPPLLVDTILTTEELKGKQFQSTRGNRLSKDGKCKLVGVARLNPVDDHYINSVLGLPSDCFASLNAIISFF